MKTLKVGIANYGKMKARTIMIAKGEHKLSKSEPKIWFASAESFAKVLSDKNRALLGLIAEQHPESITELALITGRQKSNLSRTLKTMENYGLIELRKLDGKVIPKILYRSVSLEMPIG